MTGSTLSWRECTDPEVRQGRANEPRVNRFLVDRPRLAGLVPICTQAVPPPRGRNNWCHRSDPIAPETKNQLRSERNPPRAKNKKINVSDSNLCMMKFGLYGPG